MRLSRIASALFTLAAMSSIAAAGTATDNLTVTATVADSCTITGGTLAFGTYDTVSGAAIDASGEISVACTKDATAAITLDQGSNASGTSTDADPDRRMLSGTEVLSYTLFTDSGRTTEWGNTAGTSKSYTAATSDSVAQTVFGRITADQDVPAGSYTDTVVATVTF
jgi:spore coat protein U-like protein